MSTKLHATAFAIQRAPISLSTETKAQIDIHTALTKARLSFDREFRLSAEDRIDFIGRDDCSGIGIEVKISGSSRAIFRQIERYAEHEEVRALVLATNRAMRLPDTINGKPVVVASLGGGWL